MYSTYNIYCVYIVYWIISCLEHILYKKRTLPKTCPYMYTHVMIKNIKDLYCTVCIYMYLLNIHVHVAQSLPGTSLLSPASAEKYPPRSGDRAGSWHTPLFVYKLQIGVTRTAHSDHGNCQTCC